MSILSDISSYAVFTGFQFVALCVMTRGGRGWPWRVLALAALAATDVLVESSLFFAQLPLDKWLAACFAVKWCLVGTLVFVLSRDSLGRRAFLSIAYGAYAIGFSVIFHVITYRNVLGLPTGLSVAVGLAVVAVLNLVLIFRILPLMPCDDRENRWCAPCLAAFVTAASMYVCGFWPVSVLTSPARDCAAFGLMLVGVWVAFPSFCRTMRERQHNAAVERSLELMTAEVRVRRAAIDEARRIEHDQRHHLIAVVDLLLRGKNKEALDYLSHVDGSLGALAAATRVWCENETVNAILSGYSRKAETMGVGFSAEAHVGPQAPLSDMEIVAVVANLVENAIEACAGKREGQGSRSRVESSAGQLEQTKTPLLTLTSDLDLSAVRVTIRQRGDLFGLTVTNPVPPDFRLSPAGLPCGEPGVGLNSIRRVVERYHGEWQYTLEDGQLTCELAVCVWGEG